MQWLRVIDGRLWSDPSTTDDIVIEPFRVFLHEMNGLKRHWAICIAQQDPVMTGGQNASLDRSAWTIVRSLDEL